jgi:hypothetical protein
VKSIWGTQGGKTDVYEYSPPPYSSFEAMYFTPQFQQRNFPTVLYSFDWQAGHSAEKPTRTSNKGYDSGLWPYNIDPYMETKVTQLPISQTCGMPLTPGSGCDEGSSIGRGVGGLHDQDYRLSHKCSCESFPWKIAARCREKNLLVRLHDQNNYRAQDSCPCLPVAS